MASRRAGWIWGIALFWAVIGGVLLVVALGGTTTTPRDPVLPGTQPGLRTVVVSTVRPEAASAPDGPVQASLLSGEPAAQPTVATVLTDENCEPDAQGYSHCRNELEMPDGSTIAVRHTHLMAEVQCLAPGERVNVRFV